MNYLRVSFLFFLISFSSFAITSLESHWSLDYKFELNFRCEKETAPLCQSMCGSQTDCRVEENFCHNCVGTDLYMRNLFLEMGKVYRNTKQKVSPSEFGHFIQSGNFITINSKSIYNLVDSFDAPSIRVRFQGLCDFKDDYPLVFLDADRSRFPQKVRYVVCQNPDGLDIFKMTEGFEVIRS